MECGDLRDLAPSPPVKVRSTYVPTIADGLIPDEAFGTIHPRHPEVKITQDVICVSSGEDFDTFSRALPVLLGAQSDRAYHG